MMKTLSNKELIKTSKENDDVLMNRPPKSLRPMESFHRMPSVRSQACFSINVDTKDLEKSKNDLIKK